MALGAQNVTGTLPPINIGGVLAMARYKRDQKTKDLFAYAEDNRPSIVYMATNTVNGKRYIGITRRTLQVRIYNHIGAMNGGSRLKFHNALRKHGRLAFRFQVIEDCDTYQDAKRAEQHLIAQLKPEYNLTKGGDGVLGYRPSVETRQKMSRAKKGKPSARKNYQHTAVTMAKIRATKLANPYPGYWVGKSRAQATIDKIVAAKKGKPASPKSHLANSARRSPVLCITDGLAFPSPKEAATHYGCSFGLIARVCRSGSERPWKIKKAFVYVEDWLK